MTDFDKFLLDSEEMIKANAEFIQASTPKENLLDSCYDLLEICESNIDSIPFLFKIAKKKSDLNTSFEFVIFAMMQVKTIEKILENRKSDAEREKVMEIQNKMNSITTKIGYLEFVYVTSTKRFRRWVI